MAANDAASVEHVALPVATFAVLVVVGVANQLAVGGLTSDHKTVAHRCPLWPLPLAAVLAALVALVLLLPTAFVEVVAQPTVLATFAIIAALFRL